MGETGPRVKYGRRGRSWMLRKTRVPDLTDEQKRVVNSLSNWGRNQWVRSGYSVKWLDDLIAARQGLAAQ